MNDKNVLCSDSNNFLDATRNLSLQTLTSNSLNISENLSTGVNRTSQDDEWKGQTLGVSQDVNVSGELNASYIQSIQPVPEKCIIMWFNYNGSNLPPPGWAFCDGANGTPDLRGRFVLGRGSRTNGTKGGTEVEQVTIEQIPSHTHTGSTDGNLQQATTSPNGDHTHTISFDKKGDDGGHSKKNAHKDWMLADHHRKHHTVGMTTDGDHTHSVSGSITGDGPFTVGSSGGGQAHNNMPPYYVLAYIMKIHPSQSATPAAAGTAGRLPSALPSAGGPSATGGAAAPPPPPPPPAPAPYRPRPRGGRGGYGGGSSYRIIGVGQSKPAPPSKPAPGRRSGGRRR